MVGTSYFSFTYERNCMQYISVESVVLVCRFPASWSWQKEDIYCSWSYFSRIMSHSHNCRYCTVERLFGRQNIEGRRYYNSLVRFYLIWICQTKQKIQMETLLFFFSHWSFRTIFIKPIRNQDCSISSLLTKEFTFFLVWDYWGPIRTLTNTKSAFRPSKLELSQS